MTARSLQVRGPYFDELTSGMTFGASSVTLTDGMQAVHRSIVGNRLPLFLDADLSARVTGESRQLAAPALVWDVAIGQSTVATQHVRANLYYRGLCFRRVPMIGDTLTTVTSVEGLRGNRRRADRPVTGMALLRVTTVDQEQRPVLDFWRCAMLPLAAPDSLRSGQGDDLDGFGSDPSGAEIERAVSGWDLEVFRTAVPGPHFADLEVGQRWSVDGGDVVSGAPELARLTSNVAIVHHDEVAAGGTRLVYGGHTIGLALHQMAQAIPSMVTVSAWTSCDHIAPVHEGEVLKSIVVVENLTPIATGGGVATVRSLSYARRGDGVSNPVLNWVCSVVMA